MGSFTAKAVAQNGLKTAGAAFSVVRAENPNPGGGTKKCGCGATDAIAGVRNEAGNVVGLMPHPEHAVDPDVGPTGGQALFASLFSRALAKA